MKEATIQALKEDLQKNGFTKIPRSIFCLDETSLDTLREEFERLFDGIYETGIYPDEIHWRPGISRGNVTKEICNGWKASSRIASVVCGEELGRLACSLMDWTSSRIGQDDVLHKPPKSGAVGFHQDGAYISDNFVPRENNSLTMWIALDDADEENGAVQYAPASHLWPYMSVTDVSESSFHVGEEDHFTALRQAALVAGYDPDEAVGSVETAHVKAGEMVVHHQQIWHGSGPNISLERHRRALVAHLLDGGVKWRTEQQLPHYIYGRYFIRGEETPREDFFPITYGSKDQRRTHWLDS